jgi:hypothetical protein
MINSLITKLLVITSIAVAVFVAISTFYYPILPVISEQIFGANPTTCPLIRGDENYSTTSYTGFTMTVNRYGGSVPYEFVLTPGSTGYITRTFIFGDSTENMIKTDYKTDPLKFFSNIEISGFNKLDGREIKGVPSNNTGISIYPVNSTSSYHKVIVTYAIKTDDSAPWASYGLALHTTCGGNLLTIGHTPYMHSMPADAVFLY